MLPVASCVITLWKSLRRRKIVVFKGGIPSKSYNIDEDLWNSTGNFISCPFLRLVIL